MKKNILLLSMITFSSMALAQIGINTSNPQGVFHIDGAKDNPATGIPTSTQQLNDFALLNNGNVGIGTVAPTNKLDIRSTTNGAVKIADGTQAANRVLTSDANGVATWKDIPSFTDTSIYAGNGTLTGNRTVAQAGNTLAFTSTATTGTNHFSVDGSTFSVDAVNNRVGIGTTTPKNLLDLGSGNGKKLALWNSTAGDDFYGLGNAANVLQFFAGAPATGDALMTLNKNGRVGIGTTSPTNVLDVRSTSNGAIRIVDGTQSNGAVLTSDANGVGTWKRASAQVVTGITAGGLDIPFVSEAQYRYTGNSITLPSGKWMVSINQLVRVSGTLASGDWMFLRSTFSDENLTTVGQVSTQSADVVVRPTLMSFLIQGSNTGSNKFDIKTGDVLINNTSAGNKTYRYIVGNSIVGGAPPVATKILSYGGAWAESAIFATAIN
ncbi:hypothetical protein [Chryseobacterium sp. FH2]|uniref:hypothetical protein n=1 Tax=Chryseobacterium sp. FH2 TaxID=1674291 RepID=UPI000AB4DA51|nr:hypothetical protein [Chryseobacterium sp. FH2]